MKTAMLFSGFPRFCQDFDYQLANIHGSDFEWIVLLWKNIPQEYPLSEISTPTWLRTVSNENQAREYIESRVPLNHKLKHIEFIDWNEFPTDLIQGSYPRQITIDVSRFFRQYWLLQKTVDAAFKTGTYDLFFRTRSDVGFDTPVYFDKIYQRLIAQPNRIIISSYGRQENFVDLFVIGRPEALSTYAKTVDCINDFYFNRGLVMHTETMLSSISRENGLVWEDDGYMAFLRRDGKYLVPNYVEGQKYYEPNFGKW
jgi:hypothetical protein